MTNKEKESFCPHAKKCGGCQLQNMTYPQQLAWKQKREQILLDKFGKVEPIIGMDEPTHYRNKVQAAFGRTARGKIISGVYQSNSHRIVAVDSCAIEDEIADSIIVDIRNLLPKFRIWSTMRITAPDSCAMCLSSAAFQAVRSWSSSSARLPYFR